MLPLAETWSKVENCLLHLCYGLMHKVSGVKEGITDEWIQFQWIFLVFYGASLLGSLGGLLIRCDSCHRHTSYICVFHRLWVIWARASEAINPMKERGGERQYDNSERPAVIMVFMKRWNSVQTKSVAPGKINSLALRRDPCLSWGYSKHTKTLLLFFFFFPISQEWGNEVHRLLVIIN